jgi:hypothetical protein
MRCLASAPYEMLCRELLSYQSLSFAAFAHIRGSIQQELRMSTPALKQRLISLLASKSSLLRRQYSGKIK